MSDSTGPEIERDWQLEQYDYQLPQNLIAQRPVSPRDHSKLLVWDKKKNHCQHQHFYNLSEHLPPNALLVFNQTKVFPSRLFAHKKSGGRAEVFLLQGLPDSQGNFKAMLRSSGKKVLGDHFYADQDSAIYFEVTEVIGDGTFNLKANESLTAIIEKLGSIPLPPYIRNGVADEKDQTDYQTTFAKETGSVAAPTAGLHFTPELLSKLKALGVQEVPVTLHVGPGTFAPIKAHNITEHQMHAESFQVSRESLKCLIEAWQTGRPVVAVGTTSLRTIESVHRLWRQGVKPDQIAQQWHETKLFLYPGQKVESVQGLITNFHLPKSSLLLLVASLIGRSCLHELYQQAIERQYRFYSYGDAMLLKLW